MSSQRDRLIDELLAKQEITEVLLRHARGADRCEWDLVRDSFHSDGFTDHGVFKGGVEDFIEWGSKYMSQIDGTTHATTNILIELQGDFAHVESYTTGYHRYKVPSGPSPQHFACARNIDRFERRDGRWKIARRHHVYEWQFTLVNAADFNWPEGMTFGVRGTEDPLYTDRTPPFDSKGAR